MICKDKCGIEEKYSCCYECERRTRKNGCDYGNCNTKCRDYIDYLNIESDDKITEDMLKDINELFTEEEIRKIIHKVKAYKKDKIFNQEVEEFYNYLNNNVECIGVEKNSGSGKNHNQIMSLGYSIDNKKASIIFYAPNSIEMQISSYCYNASNMDELREKIEDIHIAVKKGIIQ